MSTQLYSIAKKVYKQTIESQGASYGFRGNTPSSGYMVGLLGYETRVNILEFNPGHVDSFIRRNLPKLYNDNVYIGTWISEDLVYIDLSINLQNKAIALAYSVLQGQQCIWDVERKVEIYQLNEVQTSINQ